MLQGQPGIIIPNTVRVGRSLLEQVGAGRLDVQGVLGDGAFPIIARPVDSHAGQGLARLEDAVAVMDYLHGMAQEEFYIARFVDYRSADGLFRKYRIVLIEGAPYACHMAISDNWVIHYLNAGMAVNPSKRAEEAHFMAEFDSGFALRHAVALAAIHARTGLDYVGMDCAESADGSLLVFEVDSNMLIHAMDPPEVFPYKQAQMRKVFAAFRAMLGNALARGRSA
jgi:glutathione synthase/RimK-type ligase-like ATP-grasp enzyme